MVRLHQRTLVLIFGFERRPALAQRLRGLRWLRPIAGQLRLAVGAFGRHPAGGRFGQRLVERDQRFALERRSIARRLAVLAGRRVDDALRLRIGNQLALRLLQVGAGLGDLLLEELPGVGGGVVAALQAGIDEAVGDAVGDLRGKLRRFATT